MPIINISNDEQFLLEIIRTDDHIDNAIEYIKKSFSPEEVFPDSELKDWAENNGFVKEGQSA